MSKFLHTCHALVAGAVCLAGLAAPASATPLLSNIIVNGNAEASAGAANFGQVMAPSGWQVTGGFSAVQYAAGAAIDLNPADALALGGGSNYFAGGPNNGLSTARQRIDISDLAFDIDAGSLTAAFSALIGGWSSQGDNIVITATFLDALLGDLATLTLGPVTPGDRGNDSQLLARTTNGLVPQGARFIDVLMTATRLEGSYNDGYADNLSLVLRGGNVGTVSTPSTAALVLLGLVTLLAGSRRRA